jgi:hypothetical protein
MSLACPLSAVDAGVTYRARQGGVVETTLDRVVAGEVLTGLPVREFCWYKGRRPWFAAVSGDLRSHREDPAGR